MAGLLFYHRSGENPSRKKPLAIPMVRKMGKGLASVSPGEYCRCAFRRNGFAYRAGEKAARNA